MIEGAQWLSGRVLDLRPKGCGFEPLTGVTALCPWASHINPMLSTGSTQEDPSRLNWKIVNWEVKNQTNKRTNKQTKLHLMDFLILEYSMLKIWGQLYEPQRATHGCSRGHILHVVRFARETFLQADETTDNI